MEKTKTINLIGIDYESIVDGDGVRTVLFFSGCKHNCDGCHNPESHNFNAGKEFTEKVQNEIFSHIESSPYISGITLSGGDCFFNPIPVIKFLQLFRKRFPDKTVWGYTGFVLEEILLDKYRSKLFNMCDVIVDGKFEKDLNKPNLKFKGSTNQRIIDVKKSTKQGKVVLYE